MTEEREAHRRFAVELNNATWDVLSDGHLGAEEDPVEVLYGAYASAYHWRKAGGPANWARAEHLIARTEILLGEPSAGLAHAKRCLELVERHRDEMADWDEAFAHEAIARAHAALGDRPSAEAAYERAMALTEAIADDDDRSVLEAELVRPPWFGLRG